MRVFRELSLWSAAAVFVVTSAATASAQSTVFPSPVSFASEAAQSSGSGRPHTRGGVWFSGGLGVGSLGCEDCDERETSGIADLAIGGTLGERLLLGGAITGWHKDEDGFSLTVSTVEARLRFYPMVDKGFYLTGGVGVGSIRADLGWLGDETETGLGLTLGLGWDIRVGRNVSVTPFWHGTAVRVDEANANFGSLGVAVTIH